MIPDGLDEVKEALPLILDLIARTSRWVHPEVFRELPIWRPDTARKLPLLKADWLTPQTNKNEPKVEGNVAAQASLRAALGIFGKKPKNWTTCHIWGYDDDRFVSADSVVRDRRFFSCVGNMVLLPTPLKGFTDAVPEVKRHLRVCAFNLYGWACEHPSVSDEAARIRAGEIPIGYPAIWPTPQRQVLPPGTGPINHEIRQKIAARKLQIRHLIETASSTLYPKAEVESVLAFWKVQY